MVGSCWQRGSTPALYHQQRPSPTQTAQPSTGAGRELPNSRMGPCPALLHGTQGRQQPQQRSGSSLLGIVPCRRLPCCRPPVVRGLILMIISRFLQGGCKSRRCEHRGSNGQKAQGLMRTALRVPLPCHPVSPYGHGAILGCATQGVGAIAAEIE